MNIVMRTTGAARMTHVLLEDITTPALMTTDPDTARREVEVISSRDPETTGKEVEMNHQRDPEITRKVILIPSFEFYLTAIFTSFNILFQTLPHTLNASLTLTHRLR